MKKLWIVSLAAVAALGAGTLGLAQKSASNKQFKNKAEFIVVESAEYQAGKEDPRLTLGLSQFLEATPTVTHLTAEQARADAKLAGLDYSFLPVYLIKKTASVRTKMEKPLQMGYVKENADFFILSHQTPQGVYENKQAQPGVLEVFVMSQCPYGVRVEDLIVKAKKEGKFPADKTVKIRYIVSYDERNGFNSMHGSGEWEEDVRQLLIAKYYPSKFWKYLEIRNKDYRSSRWDKAMEQAGINVKKLMKKFDTEGMELLKAEAKHTAEFGVGASPTLIWEGKVQLGLDTAATLEGFGFLNPGAGTGVAAPAGSC